MLYGSQCELQYGAVMVRSTGLNDETHIALGRMFGELDNIAPYRNLGRANRLTSDELFDVSNVGEDGKILDTESPRGQANKVSPISALRRYVSRT